MKLRLIITIILIFYGSTLLNAQEANNMIHLENSPPTATFIFILFIGLFLRNEINNRTQQGVLYE